MKLLLGIDVGTSAVKASLVELSTGARVASATSPGAGTLPIESLHPGWAEQDPAWWWRATCEAVRSCPIPDQAEIAGIGIGYQMHGLVLCDGSMRPTRRSIIWCDSRAVAEGDSLASSLGPEVCRERLLNHPGNLTAAKMSWVARNERQVLEASRWAMLPGDWVAAKMTGQASTTAAGLSEMVLWDHANGGLAEDVLALTGCQPGLLPPVVPMVGVQGALRQPEAEELGLRAGIPVSFRAGDQPTNALSLGVLDPGQCATTAGTSGVVFAVTGGLPYDPHGSVNTFLHANHTAEDPRRGVLMCLNGCGAAYEWLARVTRASYAELDAMCAEAEPGRELFLPFGNGAERTLMNSNRGAHLTGLDFSGSGPAELAARVNEGIAFAMAYGIESMRSLGVEIGRLAAGRANMFRSQAFRGLLATVAEVPIDLRECDGSVGAAIGAGAGICAWSLAEGAALATGVSETIEPDGLQASRVQDRYGLWKEALALHLS